jgi:hypothetical protein
VPVQTDKNASKVSWLHDIYKKAHTLFTTYQVAISRVAIVLWLLLDTTKTVNEEKRLSSMVYSPTGSVVR